MTAFNKIFLAGDPMPERIDVGRGESADLVFVILPGHSCDVNLEVNLLEPGASANLSGLYLCSGDERVNITINLFHRVSECCSRQLFKGLAGGVSRVSFDGKITVCQDAQKTEAYQENHNLLLSDGAKVDSKPQLEIYADDVKCSHGATTGRLSEEEQFYMRSRGISLKEARVLQMISFIAPVLEKIPDEELRTSIEDSLRTMQW